MATLPTLNRAALAEVFKNSRTLQQFDLYIQEISALSVTTDFALTLLDDPDAATMRATLGLTNTGRFLPSNPTPTSSASPVMMGLALPYTPTASGKVEVILRGTIFSNTIGSGGFAQLAYGTGAAPANGVAATGTATATAAKHVGAIANQYTPFVVHDIVTLTVGTPYWFDLQAAALSGGAVSLTDITITLCELP
jgi:hypothetical protein